ncbi:hypothetical protein [Listeria costaricensis]|uniref:hypothetical protein n=1 Tax=Listeria costaricensis TaxID=2026604 RepID=UPI000C07B14D|nr:hypothetical protein [Listeria costaricensis]
MNSELQKKEQQLVQLRKEKEQKEEALLDLRKDNYLLEDAEEDLRRIDREHQEIMALFQEVWRGHQSRNEQLEMMEDHAIYSRKTRLEVDAAYERLDKKKQALQKDIQTTEEAETRLKKELYT